MKKLISILTAFLFIFSLAACDDNTEKPSNNQKPKEEEEVTATNIRITLPYTNDNVLNVNESFEVGIDVTPTNAVNKEYKLESSNTDVLKVEGKKITALEEGEASLTATIKDTTISSTVNFTVIGENEVLTESIRIILPESVDNNLLVSETFDVEVLVSPTNATKKEYILESLNEDILKVEGNKVTALKEGTAKLKATTKDTGVSTSISFNVTSEEVEVEYEEITIKELLQKTEFDNKKLYRVTGIISEDYQFEGRENKYGMAYLVDNEGNGIRIFRSTFFANIITNNDGIYSYDKTHAYGEEVLNEVKYGSTVTMDVLVDIHGNDLKPMIAGYIVEHYICNDCSKQMYVETTPSQGGGSFEVKSGKYNRVGIVTCTPDEGYEVEKVIITYIDGTTKEGRLDPNTPNVYQYTINAYQKIEVIFKTITA